MVTIHAASGMQLPWNLLGGQYPSPTKNISKPLHNDLQLTEMSTMVASNKCGQKGAPRKEGPTSVEKEAPSKNPSFRP